MMSVDILPTSLPREASAHFSNVLLPYLRTLVRQYRGEADATDAERVTALDNATIAGGGALKEGHRWLEEPLSSWRAQAESESSTSASAPVVAPVKKKRVLMLGSGMVAGPAVDEIARHGDVELVVGA